MIAHLPELTATMFLAFCRVSGCLMLLPGFASARVPMRIRLVTAFVISAAVAPSILHDVDISAGRQVPLGLARLIVMETAQGALIGLLGRCFMAALETLAHVMANTIGLSSAFTQGIEDNEASVATATLVTSTATVLIFIGDLHLEFISAIVRSYDFLPLGGRFDPYSALRQIDEALQTAFLLAVKSSAPFVVYGIVVNFAFGLVNRMVPAIPVYFASIPFVIMGGLVLFYFVAGEMFMTFARGFGNWMRGA